MKKDIYTVLEIAKICKVSRYTVNNWINKGIVRAFRPMEKGAWKVTRKDLADFLIKRGYPLEFLKDNRIKILVVDDEEMMTDVISKVLSQEKEYSVEIANSGFIAGAKLESFYPDVVILDIFLKDMDGRQFFEYIRNHPEIQDVKVIGMSGNLDQDKINNLLEMGFHDFLAKPFKMDELKNSITKISNE